MKIKKLRLWLASKLLGGNVIEEIDLELKKGEWIYEQVKKGNMVTLDYSVTKSSELKDMVVDGNG